MALPKKNPQIELGDYQSAIEKQLKKMDEANFVQRLWKKDESLWQKPGQSNQDVAMGWLDVTELIEEKIPEIEEFCKSIKEEGFNHIILLGMGGSSLAPLVFSEVFEKHRNNIRFTVLDTTDPDTIKRVTEEVNIATLFIVSSKSGGTAEVKALFEHFFAHMQTLKIKKTGDNFIAITDQGSPLSAIAKEKNFRKIFINFENIGGRYSALSYFGIIPAALIGIDIREVLERSNSMAANCKPSIPISNNPGVSLGCIMAEMESIGRDKLIYNVSKRLGSFGLWLEQLIAESTGKEGRGILPIENSEAGQGSKKDKVFLRINFGKNEILENETLNEPSIQITLDDEYDLGAEFLRWEIATATAGSLMGINPFDQPNVEESKKNTTQLLHQISITGQLPAMEVSYIQDSVRYYSSQKAGNGRLLLENFFSPSKRNDYIVLQAYLSETAENAELLRQISVELQKNLNLPVSVQFGPRYLHSTGQYHKGGPNTGFFIQLISSAENEINIPGRNYSFGVLKRAQAVGDREALMDHSKNVIMVDLGKNTTNALQSFRKLTTQIQSIEKRDTKYVYAYNNKEEAFEMYYTLVSEAQAYQSSIGKND